LSILVIGSVCGTTGLMSQVIAIGGLSILGCAGLILFALNFGWLAISFWNAVLGFAMRTTGGDPIRPRAIRSTGPVGRTAIVMPVYNEDVARVVAGLQSLAAGLAETGEAQSFDVFVLSDSSGPAAAAEAAMIEELRERGPDRPPIYYRRRNRNIGRKAGNIEDFIRRWGAAYRYMIVLDADSVMSAATILTLVRTMDAHPDVGIVQAPTVPTNRETAFARILQFANRLYGPIQSAGLACWTGGDGIYYGHNAIIRTDAFARLCGLPVLPGKPPLGGEILSHDFVEGALIRSGGYKVWLAPELSGSYEEMPANLVDFAKRDRRWCQGNLQHSRLLALPLLKPMGRLHLAMGVFSYLTAPLWLALLLLSTFYAIERAQGVTQYFKPGFNLFPNWPVATDWQIDLLLGITAAALFLPKLMGLALAMFSRAQRRAFGGAWRLFASCLAEIVFSSLMAPVMMLFQALAVASILLGRNIAWDTQPRHDRGVGWREAAHRLGWHTLIGLVWSIGVRAVAPDFFWWLMPIWLGLVLSVPLTVWSSRSSVGLALKRLGLFLTPEETQPPPELMRLRQALAARPQAEEQVAVAPAAALVPAEAGIAMPHLVWPQRKPAMVQQIQCSGTSDLT